MKATAFLLALPALALSAEPPPKSPDPRIRIELVAEAPDIVTPTGLGVDSKGRVLVIESHTHFRPKDYEGPERDRVLMFTPQKNGQAKRSIFYEGLNMGMDTCVGADDWVYLAERSRILRAKDSTGDGKADLVEDVISMDTTGTYPHNGLSGLCFDLKGNLVFGLGENLGHAYTMIGRDGRKIEGAKGIGGGVFRCSAEGNQLEQIARGFWNPFGVCVDSWGRIFAVDNDPGHSPPCRLLHVVQDGDYGYRYKHGRTGIHPFIAWNGELLGTLPMVYGTGEAPCEVIHFNSPTFPKEYRGRLLVTSWGDHRVESYILKPNGASVTASMEPLIQGGDSFRPVGLAMAPDGSLYASDWGSSSYNLNHKGRLWRIHPTRDFQAPALKEPDYLKPSQKQFTALSAGQLPQGKTFPEIALTSPDPFIRHAALSNLPKNPISKELHAHVARYSETRNIQPGKLTLVDLIKKEPAILFEFLRWTAEDGIQANRPVIEGILNSGQIDYRNFRAALACLDSLSGRNNPDRFNEKYARPLLQSETTPETLRANILRYFPDNHAAIDDRKLAEWITAKNPQLQREAIWKSRTHLTESTNLSLRKLALDAKAPFPLRLEATAALGNSESPDTGTLVEILQLENAKLQAEALRSLVGAHHEAVTAAKVNAIDSASARRAMGKAFNADYPAPNDTQAWLKRIDSLPGQADAETGRRIFFHSRIGTCSKCHQINGRGTRVGPDLTRIGHGITRERLMESILQPNKEVSPYMRPWAIRTQDGKNHMGIAMRRGGNSEAYLGIDGKEFHINKLTIVTKQELHTSMMPPGLAHTLTLSELRDLLAYLMQKR